MRNGTAWSEFVCADVVAYEDLRAGMVCVRTGCLGHCLARISETQGQPALAVEILASEYCRGGADLGDKSIEIIAIKLKCATYLKDLLFTN